MSPARLDEIVRTCLAKDPEHRWQSARDLGREVKGIIERDLAASADASISVAVTGRLQVWQRPFPLLLAGVALLTIIGVAVWTATRPRVRPSTRTFLAVSTEEPLWLSGPSTDVAISPGGRHVVYLRTRDGHSELRVRSLDQLEELPLVDLGRSPSNHPFFSPDGNWVGYFDDRRLMRVSNRGGPPVPIADFSEAAVLSEGSATRGASWGDGDTIVFALSGNSGLWRVATDGGEPESLTTPDVEQGARAHWWPEVLPGGRALVFTIVRSPIENSQIALLDLTTDEVKVLGPRGGNAQYSPTGHLIYGAGGTLWAVGFDLERLEVIDPTPVPVQEGVLTKTTGAANFDLALDGSLVYIAGSLQTDERGHGEERTLAWVDRQGREEQVAAELRPYYLTRVSPDGTRVAVDIWEEDRNVWIYNFSGATLTRLTGDVGRGSYPVWTQDGLDVIWGGWRDGDLRRRNLYRGAADGTGPVVRLTSSPNDQVPLYVTPDGAQLIFSERRLGTGNVDIGMVALASEEHGVEWLLATPFVEMNPALSPDGRWLAYESNQSGAMEVYVKPFPNVDDGQTLVSQRGGRWPVWAPSDGDLELFYRTSEGMMAATLDAEPRLRVRAREHLFENEVFTGDGRTYDIAPDGARFLVVKESVSGETAGAQIILVQDWFDELQRLVPTP